MLKICPVCKLQVELHTQACPQCKHAFRTQFNTPPDLNKTQAFYQPPQPAFHQQMYGIIQCQPGTHPWILAGLLSLLCIIGLGQLINKQYGKAAVLLGSAILGNAIVPCVALIAAYIISVVDAFIVGQRLYRGEAIRAWQWF